MHDPDWYCCNSPGNFARSFCNFLLASAICLSTDLDLEGVGLDLGGGVVF
jgi:hypothetical protein